MNGIYICPTPIGNMEDITLRALNTLKLVDVVFCEDTRVTGQLLKYFDISKKLISSHEYNESKNKEKMIEYLRNGSNVGLVSDRGTPIISDPGYELVKEVIAHEFNVVPISGANACLNALVVSGICPQPFLFYGFLDHSDKKKKKELEELKKYKETFVLYEAPHRIKKTLTLMKDILGNRNIALAREITKKHEEILRGTIEEILDVVDELKGEMVLVVEGSSEEVVEEVFEQSIEEHVNEYIEKGMSTKDAIKEVAKLRNVSKNEIYQEYHKK